MGESRTRIGVVGVGYFGRFHALKFAGHPRARLMALADPDPARLVDVAAECYAQAYTEPEALLGMVDAVSIAAPAILHGALARLFLEAGVHVLVEKPLAATLAEARTLVGLAKAEGLVLQVGHQERAVLAEAGLFEIPEKPTRIDCLRKGPFTGRNLDVDVVLDLMTHDLDMAHVLAPGAIEQVTAEGGVERSALLDRVEARLALAGGTVATFSASRVHGARERHMTLHYRSGRIHIDFLARRVENTTPFPLRDLFPEGGAGVTADPLGYALDRFLAAIRGEGPPLVSGEEACFALEAADRIRAAIPTAGQR